MLSLPDTPKYCVPQTALVLQPDPRVAGVESRMLPVHAAFDDLSHKCVHLVMLRGLSVLCVTRHQNLVASCPSAL